MSSSNDFIIQRAVAANVPVRETFAGLIEILSDRQNHCPICNRAATHEVEQQDQLFIEVFIGCEECQIYWYWYEEPIQ